MDEKHRKIIQEVESLKNVRNVATEEISELKKNKQDADDKIAAMKEVSDKIKSIDYELRFFDNEIVRTWGEPTVQATK